MAKGILEAGALTKSKDQCATQITVTFNIDEGIQYLMGELKIEGKSNAAGKLTAKMGAEAG